MTASHLHLVVNHAPLFASAFALPLLAWAAWRVDRSLWRAAVLLLGLGAVGAVVALKSGEAAEEWAEDQGEGAVSEARLEEHEERAERATVLAVLTGIGALGGLALGRGRERVVMIATFAAAAGTLAIMAWTANAGGLLRHAEELGASSGDDNASRK